MKVVQGMKVGSTRKLPIPSELGYGTGGVVGMNPPNTSLIFDIELFSLR
jgi:FKBP-type peptidyl-prolyl cis-trans isomerase